MCAAGSDGGDSACEPVDLCGGPPVGGGVVAQLAVVILAPAFHCSAGQQCARVFVAGCDGGDSAGEPVDLCGSRPVDGGVVAYPAAQVVAPAFHCSGGQQCTRVHAAGSDGGDSTGEPVHLCGNQSVGCGVVA